MLDPAMSNFDTLGRGWAWGLVALAILLGKTPATTTTKTKHQTPNTKPTNNTNDTTTAYYTMLCHRHRMSCCTMPRHAMPCYCYAMLCMEFYAKGCALTRVMCGCLYSVVVVAVGLLHWTAVGSGVFQKREGVLLRRKRAYGDLGRTSGTNLHNHNQTTASPTSSLLLLLSCYRYPTSSSPTAPRLLCPPVALLSSVACALLCLGHTFVS